MTEYEELRDDYKIFWDIFWRVAHANDVVCEYISRLAQVIVAKSVRHDQDEPEPTQTICGEKVFKYEFYKSKSIL